MRFILFTVSILFSLTLRSQSDQFERLKTQFDSCQKNKLHEQALNIAKQMNSSVLRMETDSSLRYAVSYRYIGNSYSSMHLDDSAIYYWNKSLAILNNQNRLYSLDASYCYNNLGNFYFTKSDYNSAENFYNKALGIYKMALNEDDPKIELTLNILGELYYNMGDYKRAENSYESASEIIKKYFGNQNLRFANSQFKLGSLYFKIRNYKSAELLYKESLSIRIKEIGAEHPEVADNLMSLGNLYSILGNYKVAEPLFNKALVIYRKSFGQDHIDVAGILNNLGSLYIDMGDYKAAEPLYKESLEIYKKIFGDNHNKVAMSLNNLGRLYSTIGEYMTAESFFNQSLTINIKLLGEEHEDLATTYNELGLLSSTMGDYKTAEMFYFKALGICKKTFGEDDPNVSMVLNNLGNLYSEMSDFKSAEPLYKQGLLFTIKAYGENHLDVALILNNLGDLYSDFGKYKSAEQLYIQALLIKKKILGEVHPDVSETLLSLAKLYNYTGDYKAADSLFKEVLFIRKKALGEYHPDYISTEISLAYLYLKINREYEAYDILSKSYLKTSKKVADNFEWLSDNKKEAYWKNEIKFYNKLSWFANEVHYKVPESVGLNYNAALLTKSKLLESKISTENYYLDIDALRQELIYRRRLIAKIESDGSSNIDQLKILHKEADSLDKRLILSWPEYAQQKKNLSITWSQVQENLTEGEAAIEFVRYENENDSLTYYNALVLKKGDMYPTLIALCKEKDLKSITPMFGSGEYYSLIWKPLESILVGVKTIYYAPIGVLYNVPFHSILVSDQNKEYLMDRYALHQLTSTRYLAMGLKQKEKDRLKSVITMVGGVNYNYLPQISTEPEKIKNEGFRNQPTLGKLDYLPGTKTEVEQIASSVLLNNWNTKVFMNNDATEENIIKMEGREAPGILHLATHGYVFPEYDFKDTKISKNSLRYSYRYSTNSMVRSGLILAGGNWAWTGSDTLTKVGAEQNGILTALEVSQLNLRNTKLVVLSACETGLGKIEGSEGTFGIKRGFKLAGVEQIIVSLWPVPDKETIELMSLFYNDLSTSLNPVISFEKAQKAMRNKYPASPQRWAGFVLIR